MQRDNQEDSQDLARDNDYAIIYESNEVIKAVQLRAGDKYQSQSANFRYLNMVKIPWGTSVCSFNKPEVSVTVLKPTSTLITETLSRKTQILYSMDNSAILFKLDLKPGDVVVEAGTGSGSLSCAIAECISSNGRLFTFEFNKERAQITKQFFEKLGKANITSTWRDIVNDGFTIEGDDYVADALFLDIPNPWAALANAKKVLRKNGRICCFSPCIEQVQRTCEQMRLMRMKNIETHETIIRQFQWAKKQTDLESIGQRKRMNCYSKAVHSNRGHTGYLTFAVV